MPLALGARSQQPRWRRQKQMSSHVYGATLLGVDGLKVTAEVDF